MLENFEIWSAVLVLLGFGLVFGFYFLKRSRVAKDLRRQGLFFQSPHGPIFYSQRGPRTGTPMILIHGIGGSGYCWRRLAPLLEKHFNLIIVDLWGFGQSEKDPRVVPTLDLHRETIESLMEHLKIPKAHFVGCSMGGAIALWLAYKNPQRVIQLITLAPAAHFAIFPQVITKFGWLSRLTPLMVNRTFIQKILGVIYTDPSHVTTEAVDAYLRPYLDRKAHQTFANHLTLLKSPELFQCLPQVEVPLLVLWGDKDRIIPKKLRTEILDQAPRAILRTHPKAGHHVMEEDPDWCSAEIFTFLKSSST